MTRGQLRRSLAVEALLLSLVAGVVGVVLGTLFGWLGSYMVFSLYGKTVLPFDGMKRHRACGGRHRSPARQRVPGPSRSQDAACRGSG